MSAHRRRDLFGSGFAALVMAAAAAGSAKAREVDGDLLDMCAEFQEHHATLQRLDTWFHDADHNDPVYLEARGAASAELDAANDAWHDLVEEIIDTPARTPEGVRAKAGVLAPALQQLAVAGWNATVAEDGAKLSNERLAWSLAHDILGRPA